MHLDSGHVTIQEKKKKDKKIQVSVTIQKIIIVITIIKKRKKKKKEYDLGGDTDPTCQLHLVWPNSPKIFIWSMNQKQPP